MFAPESKKEINAVRNWLATKIPGFQYNTTALWLGFEKPRHCDGTGRMPGKKNFFEQWAPGSCENRAAMNDRIFSSGEPNNRRHEHCVLNPYNDVVWDVECVNDRVPYAVCEINVDFIT